MHAKFKQLDEKKTSLAMVAFVTSKNARIRLGEKLGILGSRAFYFDTDSILYNYDPKLTNIEEGEYSGIGPAKMRLQLLSTAVWALRRTPYLNKMRRPKQR